MGCFKTGVCLMLNRVYLAAFCPSDLDTCQRVFERLCVELKVERTSEKAAQLAKIVLFLFHNGLMDEADLLRAASAASYTAAPLANAAGEKANSRPKNPGAKRAVGLPRLSGASRRL
jgi:hypothetical protein